MTSIDVMYDSKKLATSYVSVYEEGDICDFDPSYNYTTIVKHVCDLDVKGVGEPVIEKVSKCQFQITWYSELACPVCSYLYIDTHKGKCSQNSNTRRTTYTPNAKCIIPD